ncbi:MAG: Uma2 family endonuclease [Longimicrobiaceae bacterium]
MTLAQPVVTPAEYLALERSAREKSEYINGRIYAMAGTSRVHNRIVANVIIALGNQMRGRPCEAYVSDMRVKVQHTGMYTYPDVVALCGEAQLEDAELDTLLNPSVIIEVLSPSTESYDRGEKFAHYRRLESLQEYVLVAQVRRRIEHFRREGDHWVLTEISDADGVLPLSSLGCTLALADIYERVEFPAADIAR